MTRLAIAFALLFSSCSCGTLYNETHAGTTVERHVKGAPSRDDVARVERIFAEEAAKAGVVFVPEEALVVEWHADGEAFRIDRITIPTTKAASCENPLMLGDGVHTECDYFVHGDSPDGHHTRVSSWPLLCHELAHVALWRLYGDGDGAHAPPHWTPEVDAAIKRCEPIKVLNSIEALGHEPVDYTCSMRASALMPVQQTLERWHQLGGDLGVVPASRGQPDAHGVHPHGGSYRHAQQGRLGVQQRDQRRARHRHRRG